MGLSAAKACRSPDGRLSYSLTNMHDPRSGSTKSLQLVRLPRWLKGRLEAAPGVYCNSKASRGSIWYQTEIPSASISWQPPMGEIASWQLRQSDRVLRIHSTAGQ